MKRFLPFQNTKKQSNPNPKDIIEQILSGRTEYQKDYNTTQVKSALKDQPVGTYLLRESSLNTNPRVIDKDQAWFIALSYVSEPRQVLSTLIVFLYENQRFYLSTNSGKADTVAEFIKEAYDFANLDVAINEYPKLKELSFVLTPWKKPNEANSEGAYLEYPEPPSRTPSVKWP